MLNRISFIIVAFSIASFFSYTWAATPKKPKKPMRSAKKAKPKVAANPLSAIQEAEKTAHAENSSSKQNGSNKYSAALSQLDTIDYRDLTWTQYQTVKGLKELYRARIVISRRIARAKNYSQNKKDCDAYKELAEADQYKYHYADPTQREFIDKNLLEYRTKCPNRYGSEDSAEHHRRTYRKSSSASKSLYSSGKNAATKKSNSTSNKLLDNTKAAGKKEGKRRANKKANDLLKF